LKGVMTELRRVFSAMREETFGSDNFRSRKIVGLQNIAAIPQSTYFVERIASRGACRSPKEVS